jgi:hypothetical protein
MAGLPGHEDSIQKWIFRMPVDSWAAGTSQKSLKKCEKVRKSASFCAHFVAFV